MINNTATLMTHGNKALRKPLVKLANRLLGEICADNIIRKNIKYDGKNLWVGEERVTLDYENVYVIGFGKAAGEMARAMEEMLGERMAGGYVNTNHRVKLKKIKLNLCSHPLPDENTVKNSKKILELVEKAGERDLIIFLISGGASSLFEIPRDGITLEEGRENVKNMLESGADILEINRERIKLSGVKGGRLLRYVKPASCISLLISDVVNSPEFVGSGPTYGEYEKCKNFVIADNEYGKIKAMKIAMEMGYNAKISSRVLMGEPRDIARILVGEMEREKITIWGGETTVNVSNSTGKGGRNQELALYLAREIRGRNMAFLCLGTDGIDGNGPAAGGIVDGETMQRIETKGINIEKELRNHNSYGVLKSLGDAILTGATGTNIADICIGIEK